MRTLDEINASMAEIDARQEELRTEAASVNPETEAGKLADLEARSSALATEREQLDAELAQLKEEAEKAEEARKAVENGAGKTKEILTEGKKMNLEELRSSKEYVNAYADYLKSEILGKPDDTELRKLMTENVETYGEVPVPVLVDDIVRHAWENENILSRVKKTGFKGNVKVAFEKNADPAYVHDEGATAHTEEALELGIVTLTPKNIKKWITVTDEMIETTGEGFLRYVYEEIAYQVMKKLSYDVVGDIKDCAYTSHQATAVGIPKVNMDPGLTTIATAVANLSDEAQNIVVLLNPLTKVNFLAAYAAGNFAVDPFQGLTVITTGAIPAFDSCDANATYCIVGDLSAEQVNFPAGEGLKLINDPYSLAEQDLQKIVGRVYAGHGVTAPGRLVRLTKEAGAVTT